jgi:hypothetical protein
MNLSWIGTALNFVLGLFGYSKAADPVALAQKTGEELGTVKTQSAIAQEGLHEIDLAQQARDRVDSDIASHPERVREPDGDAASRGADGVS